MSPDEARTRGTYIQYAMHKVNSEGWSKCCIKSLTKSVLHRKSGTNVNLRGDLISKERWRERAKERARERKRDRERHAEREKNV